MYLTFQLQLPLRLSSSFLEDEITDPLDLHHIRKLMSSFISTTLTT